MTAESPFFFADERVMLHVEAEPKKVYYVRGAARAFPIPGFSPYIVLGGCGNISFAPAGTLIWAPSMEKGGVPRQTSRPRLLVCALKRHRRGKPATAPLRGAELFEPSPPVGTVSRVCSSRRYALHALTRSLCTDSLLPYITMSLKRFLAVFDYPPCISSHKGFCSL